MKRFNTILFTLICVLMLGATAWGQLITEPFNYTAHATNGLAAQSGGVWFNVNTGDSVLVDAGSLSYTGFAASTGNKIKFDGAGIDPQRTFTSQTTGTIYYSFLLNCTSLTGITSTTGGYFTGFRGGGSTTFGNVIWIKNNGGSSYYIGISPRSSGGTPVQTYTATSYPLNTTILIVASYQYVIGTPNDIVKLWINPSSGSFGGSEPTADLTITNNATGGDLTSIDGVFLRQAAATDIPFLQMDEERVGTTWASVTPAGVLPTQFRTIATGDWSNTTTWNMSTDGGTNWVTATSTPTSTDGAITILNTHYVTVTASISVDQLTVATGGVIYVNGGQTLTIADGTGTDATINGTLGFWGTIAGAGNIAVNGGSILVYEGGWGGNTNTYTYDADGYLAFQTSTSYGVNGDSYWPTSSGPQNVVTQGTGGITMNVPRTVGGIFAYGSGTVINASNLTLNGWTNVMTGGWLNSSPTYGGSSTLLYSTGYTVSNEWGSSVGNYPRDVRINPSLVVNMPSSDRTCPGNLLVSGTLALNGTSGDLYVGGDMTVGGTFTANGRAVFFNGGSSQTLTASGGVTFDWCGINKAGGSLNLANDMTVNNTLWFTAGNIVTSTNTLTIGGGGGISRTSGHVIGNLKMVYSSSVSKDFTVGTANGYSPVTVNGTGSGDFTVTAVQSSFTPAYSANQLARYWTLTNGGLTSADLTFNYLDADIVGNENNYSIRKYDGSWSSPGGTVTAGSNSAAITGVTSFSSWTLAEPATVPLITLTGTLTDFGNVVVNTNSSEQNYQVDGAYLSDDIVITAPAHFKVSHTTGSGFQDTIHLAQSGGTVPTTTVYARFSPTTVGSKSGNITHTSAGATQKDQAVSGKALSTEPTTQASAVGFSNVTAISMTVSWTNGDGTDRIVVAKAGSAVDANPADGTTYTDNAAFGNGTQIPTGNYVIYKGTGTSVPLTNLSPTTTYHFAVYEFNGSAGTENYLMTPATNFQQTIAGTYAWIGGNSAWTTAGNWSPTRTAPATTDILQFNSGGTVTVTAVPAQTIGQLIVSNSTTVYLQAGAANTLTIGGGTGTDLQLDAGSQLNINGASALIISLSTGATASISGSMTFSTAINKLTGTDASSIVFTSGSSITQAAGNTSNIFGTTALNSVIFQSGSSFYFYTGSNPFGASAPNSVTTFQPGSTYYHRSSGTPSFSGRKYANYTQQYTANITNSFSRPVEFYSVQIDSGSLKLWNSGTTDSTIKIYGNLINNSPTGGDLLFRAGTTNPIQFLSGGTQTISGTSSGTIRLNSNITVPGGTTLVLSRSINDSSGTMTVNGTLDCGTNTVAGGGVGGATAGVTIASGGVLKTTNTNAGGALAGAITVNGGLTLSSGSTVEFNGTSAQFAALRTFSNVTFNNNAGVSLLGNLTIDGDLSVSSGTLDLGTYTVDRSTTGGTITLANGTTLKIGGTNGFPANYATHSVGSTSTVEYSGTTQAVSNETYGNLILSGSGTKTAATGATAAGTTTSGSGVTFATGGTFTNNGTANINGTFQIDAGGYASGNDLIYGSGTTLVFNHTGGTYDVNSGYAAYWPSTNGPTNVTVVSTAIAVNTPRTVGGIIQTGNGIYNANNLTINGTAQINSGGWFAAAPTYGSASTLVYNSGGAYGVGSEWGSGSSVGSGVPMNVLIHNTSDVTLPTTDRYVPGDLTINNAILNMNSGGGDLYVAGNFTKSSTFTPNGRTVVFNGTGTQNLSTDGITFYGLTINKPSGGLYINTDITVNGALTVTSGTLNTGIHKVMLGSAGSLSEAGNGNVVLGNMEVSRTLSATGNETFGNIGIEMNPTASPYPDATTITRVTGAAKTGGGNEGIKRYYGVTAGTSTGLNLDLVFHYDDATAELNGRDENKLLLFRSPTGNDPWSDEGLTSRNTTTNTITLNGVTNLSTWSASDSANPLATNTSFFSDVVGVSSSEVSTISSLKNEPSALTSTEGEQVWQLTIRDGGGTSDYDTYPTELVAMSLTQGTGNEVPNWANAILAADLFDGSTHIDTGVIGATSITFPSFSASAADGGSKTLSVRISLKDPLPVSADNQNFVFEVLNSNVTAGGLSTSSQFALFTAPVSNSSSNKIDVIATKMAFTTQPPSTAYLNTNFSASVTAQDVNDNTDADYATNVTLSLNTGTGNLSAVSTLTHSPTNGVASWTDLQYDKGENGVVIKAASGSFTDVISNTFDVLIPTSTVSDVIAVGSSESATISSLVNNASPLGSADGVQAWQVTVRDGGGSADVDLLPTILKSISFTTAASGNTVPNWSNAILAADLFDGSTWLASGTVGTSSIAFTGLTVTVADNSSKTLSLRISLRNPLPSGSDGEAFRLRVTSANVTTDDASTSSQFASFTEAVSANGQNVIDVTATAIAFTTQPQTGKFVNQNVAPVAVTARDANGNIDLGYTGAVTLSSATFTLASTDVGNLIQNAINGVASWTNLTSSTSGNGTILADAGSFTQAVSNSITVMSGVVTSVTSGNWSAGTTWDQGSKPAATQMAVIAAGHTVTMTVTDTCEAATVKTGGVLDMVSYALQLRGTCTLESGAEAKMSAYNPLPGNGITPYNFDVASIFTFYGSTTGFSLRNPSVQTVTFGNVNWGSSANATPAVGTVIAGNLVKSNTGELRCGTGSTTSRTIVVYGNVDVQSGILTMNNGTSPITGGMDVDGNLTIQTGATLRGVNYTGSGTLKIGGNLINNGGTIAVDDGSGSGNFIVSFKGTGNTNLDPGATNAFRTVNIAAGRTVNLINNNMTINSTYTFSDTGTFNCGTNIVTGAGNFVLTSGATLGIGSPDGITTSGTTGNIQVVGTRTFDPTANYAYNGSVAQVTGNGFPADCNNLTINNAAGVTLSSNHAVNGVLTLTSGNVITGVDKLAISSTGSISRTSGHIFGNLQLHIPTGSGVTRTFHIGDASNYTPILFTAGIVTDVGELTATVNPVEHSQIATSGIDNAKSVNRYYTFTNNGIVLNNYSAVFNFVSGDVDPGASPLNFISKRYDGVNWNALTMGTRTLTSTEVTGVTSFSDFAIGEAVTVTTYQLTVSATTGGTITVPDPSPVTVDHGVATTITAVGSTGYTFTGWTVVSGTGVAFANASALSTTATLTSGNVEVRANFTLDTYQLTVSATTGGTITVPASSPVTVEHGVATTITAVGSTGYTFSGWTVEVGSAAIANASALSTTATLTSGDATVQANFIEDPAYQMMYRSFRAESLALDRDNKGKINKYVLRKSVRSNFIAKLGADSMNVNSLHMEFGSGIDTTFPFYTVPPSTITATVGDTKLKKWELSFGTALNTGDSIEVHGFGNQGKVQKVSKYYFGRGATMFTRKSRKDPLFTRNLLCLPMPNRVNALYETFYNTRYGVDGMVIGKNWKTPVDSSKYYGWFQTIKYGDVLKTLYVSRTGQMHDGAARGFDYVAGTTPKPLLKQKKTLPPTVFNNKLLADMIALKLNIVSSAWEYTPIGYGELKYDDGTTNPLNGMMLKEIASYGDSLMMGWLVDSTYIKSGRPVTVKVHKFVGADTFAVLGNVVAKIDSAFEGKIDTVSFVSGLKYTGFRKLADVSYLKANPGVIPSKMISLDNNYTSQEPAEFALYQNYPNPFNPTTTIQFDLPMEALVTLKIYNVLGQEMATILDRQDMNEGTQEVQFNANEFSSGIYFYRIVAEGMDDDGATTSTYQTVKKMMLLK